MLVLTRKQGEKVTIGNDITVFVVEVIGDSVRLGFDAPKEMPIHRDNAVRKAPRLSKQRER